MTVRYPDLIDYLSVAAEVTALDVDALSRVTNLDLADSALHAPARLGRGGLLPGFHRQGRRAPSPLGKEPPSPRWEQARSVGDAPPVYSIEMNGWSWKEYPSVEEAEDAVVAVAAGEWDEASVATWLGSRLRRSQ